MPQRAEPVGPARHGGRIGRVARRRVDPEVHRVILLSVSGARRRTPRAARRTRRRARRARPSRGD
jgi:hypothetical protein